MNMVERPTLFGVTTATVVIILLSPVAPPKLSTAEQLKSSSGLVAQSMVANTTDCASPFLKLKEIQDFLAESKRESQQSSVGQERSTNLIIQKKLFRLKAAGNHSLKRVYAKSRRGFLNTSATVETTARSAKFKTTRLMGAETRRLKSLLTTYQNWLYPKSPALPDQAYFAPAYIPAVKLETGNESIDHSILRIGRLVERVTRRLQ